MNRKSTSHPIHRMMLALAIMLALGAAEMALAASTPTPTPDTSDTATPILDSDIVYQVVFLRDENTLAIYRSLADSEPIGELNNGDPVELVEVSQTDDGETWALIRSDDQVGWVNRNDLIGNVDADLFCNDPRIEDLIAALQDIVHNQDGQAFAEMVSPRGLYMSVRGGRTVFLQPDEVSHFFEDDAPRNWGNNGYSGVDYIGSLAEDVLPLMQRDFWSGNLIVACNDNQDSLSSRNVLYPLNIHYSYPITNFYSIVQPGAPGHKLEWQAWGLAFEYWEGKPRLMGLAMYRWTP